MATIETNGRTHEPSLRELTVQVDYVEKLVDTKIKSVTDVMNERHLQYKERAEAAEKAVSAALISSKEAITKSENSQTIYNQGHNDLSRKMEAQYGEMVPRTEASVKWNGFDKEFEDVKNNVSQNRDDHQKDITNIRQELMKEIASLRESRSELSGKDTRQSEVQAQRNWGIGVIVSVIFSLASLITTILLAVKK